MVVHLAVEIQAMIYNATMVRRLFTKFQFNTCKTKKDIPTIYKIRVNKFYT